jgi:hypothetical protein
MTLPMRGLLGLTYKIRVSCWAPCSLRSGLFSVFLDVKPVVKCVIHAIGVTHSGDGRKFAQADANLRPRREWARCPDSHALLGHIENAAKHSLGTAGATRIKRREAVRREARLDSPLGITDFIRLNRPLCVERTGLGVGQDRCNEFHRENRPHSFKEFFLCNGIGLPV